jgi:CTP:molybdopterin cytidylyltransferase MocA
VEAVILAAGRGERLDGIAAAYHKPLLVANGRPLVQQAVDFAMQVGVQRPIIVVAPGNADPISQVLGDRPVKMIIQRRPVGPGNALRIGLELVAPHEKTLVLMGDNLSHYADISKVCQASYAVGVQLVNDAEAERFTWVKPDNTWVEKVRPTDADREPATGMVAAWCGPLLIDGDTARDYYDMYPDRQVAIGPWLNELIPSGEQLHLVPVSTYDIGVQEAVEAVT